MRQVWGQRFGWENVLQLGTVLGILTIVLSSVVVTYSADLTLGDPRTMTFKPVEFSPPEPERLVLDNGMVLYLLEDHELPLVTITATMRTGSWLDPTDKIGLAGMTGAVMRTGGGGGLSAEQVDEELEQFAADVSIGIGRQSGSASLDVLSKDVNRGLEIFAGLIRTPAFDPARVELARLQAIEGIRRRQDSPGSIVGREFAKVLYGPVHPSARESSMDSINRITRDDLVAFHRNTIHPNGMILGVTGDFNKAEMVASLRRVFGDWKKGMVPELRISDVPEVELSRPSGSSGRIPRRRIFGWDISRSGRMTATMPHWPSRTIFWAAVRSGAACLTMCGRNGGWPIPSAAASIRACMTRGSG